MVRLAEIRLCSKGLVRPFVLGVFSSVVISEGLAQMLRKACKSTNERIAHFTSRLVLELCDLRVARLAFDGHLKRVLALSRDRRIRFPMSSHLPPFDLLGALGDGNSVGNMGLSVFSGMASLLPFLVGADQVQNQIAFFGIDPLINSLVAYGEFWMKLAPKSGGEFRRPAGNDPSADIASNARFLEAVSLMADDVSCHGPLMGFVRKIVPRTDRRCVPLEFARQGADVSAELSSNGSKRLSFAPKHSNEVAFILG